MRNVISETSSPEWDNFRNYLEQEGLTGNDRLEKLFARYGIRPKIMDAGNGYTYNHYSREANTLYYDDIMKKMYEFHILTEEQYLLYEEICTGITLLRGFFVDFHNGKDLGGYDMDDPLVRFLNHDYMGYIVESLDVLMTCISTNRATTRSDDLIKLFSSLLSRLQGVVMRYTDVIQNVGGIQESIEIKKLKRIFPENPLALDMMGIVRDSIEKNMASWIAGKRLDDMSIEFLYNASSRIPYDPIFIRIVEELMRNSVKCFMLRKQESQTLSVSIYLSYEDGMIRFAIGDNSEGLNWKKILSVSASLVAAGSLDTVPPRVHQLLSEANTTGVIPASLSIADIQDLIFRGGVSTSGTQGYGLNAIHDLIQRNGGTVEVKEGLNGGIVFHGTYLVGTTE